MPRTAFYQSDTGLTIYAKPSPLTDWAGDVVVFAENAALGEYSGLIGDEDHVVFKQAGAEPAATDERVAVVSAAVTPPTVDQIVAAMQAVAGDFRANVAGLAMEASVAGIADELMGVKAITDAMEITDGNVHVIVQDIVVAALERFATQALGVSAVDDSVIDQSRGSGGGGSGDATEAKQDQILSKLTSRVATSMPVDVKGRITAAIVIEDDYLAAHSRAFAWRVDAVPNQSHEQCKAYFAAEYEGHRFQVTGAIADNGDNTWDLSFDLLATDTQGLSPGEYTWSVQVTDTDGKQVTRVRSDSHRATLVSKPVVQPAE